MSWRVLGIAAQRIIGGQSARLLLLTMAQRADDDGNGVFASVTTLARESEMSDRTVQRTLKALIDQGLVRFVGTRPCKNGYTNEYRLLLPAIEALPSNAPERDEAAASPAKTGHRRHRDTGGDLADGRQIVAGPVTERHLTGDRLSPKPIQEPIQEPIAAAAREQGAGERARASAAVAAPRGPMDRDAVALWSKRMDAALELAGKAINPTRYENRAWRDFRALCEPSSGEPCDWDLDVIPAIVAVTGAYAARGEMLATWVPVCREAVKNRDHRLLGSATHATPVEPEARRLTADEPYTDDLAGIAAQAGLVNGSGKAAFAEWRDYHLERGTRMVDRGASFARWLRRQKPEGVNDGQRGHGSDGVGVADAHGGAGAARSGRQQRRPASHADILAGLARRARDAGM